MEKITLVSRILLGLIFVIFGLNGFINFLPAFSMSIEGVNFMSALMQTGYLLPLIYFLLIVCGALLLLGMYLPLSVLLLLPIVVNIILFHVFLSMEGIIIAMIILVLEVILVISYKELYLTLFNK